MIETAFADVRGDSGERNNNRIFWKKRETGREHFSERFFEGPNGIIFVFMNDFIEKSTACADIINRWQIVAFWAGLIVNFGFAIWTNIIILLKDVNFTTIANWLPKLATTPTGVRSK